MALQICPSCHEKEFTWYMSENDTGQEITMWACTCGYEAQEDERLERSCQYYLDGRESQLTDTKYMYWWCYRCHRTTTITASNPA